MDSSFSSPFQSAGPPLPRTRIGWPANSRKPCAKGSPRSLTSSCTPNPDRPSEGVALAGPSFLVLGVRGQVVKVEMARSIYGAIRVQALGGAAPTITDVALGPVTRQASSMKLV